MNSFKAFRIHERAGKIAAGFEQMTTDALTPGEVVIRVRYSSINYKDALAATGTARILRKYPLKDRCRHSMDTCAGSWPCRSPPARPCS